MKFVDVAEQLTAAAAEKENPFEFIEETSGLNLGDYKCVFYYTFQKIGAYGFRLKDERISTIQANVKSLELLYRTPFHEYSHEFFQTFTNDSDFVKLSETMVSDRGFYDYWDSRPGLKSNYTWRGFLEENLVEGFAKFLSYKFYGSEPYGATYYYDMDFYDYLRKIEFDPSRTSLEEASFGFYLEVME